MSRRYLREVLGNWEDVLQDSTFVIATFTIMWFVVFRVCPTVVSGFGSTFGGEGRSDEIMI